ncbi:hypothetical protein [Pontibacter sp. FD36]|uniref:hypothetical protein n=1 Tax=Pontibacter sp. FD36 TaxID=2789860 RepID=UPI0018AB2D46|nr:hypothetical protein [Pontibacter sp. FD36]
MKISEDSDLRILQIQMILKKQLRRNVSKKQVITSAIKALEERMGIIVEGKSDGNE